MSRSIDEVLDTTSYQKYYEGTRLIAEHNGKNSRILRKSAGKPLKPLMLGQEETSTTRCLWGWERLDNFQWFLNV